jgi:glycosyltransferase involved in cell wall biosynthesis
LQVVKLNAVDNVCVADQKIPLEGNKMQVMFDARMAFHTGIGRYIRSLCHVMSTQSPDCSLSLLVDPRSSSATAWPAAFKTVPYPAEIYSLGEQWYGSRLCRTLAARTDVFHFPHYNVPWWLPTNSVVTIHDLTHFQFPQYFARYRVWPAWCLLQRAVRRAGHVIAVSEATRRPLVERLPAAKGKTTVIHHGVDNHFVPLSADITRAFKHAEQLDRFFLYVGNSKPHKNLARLLMAFARLREQFSHVELVLLNLLNRGRWWTVFESMHRYRMHSWCAGTTLHRR